MPAGADANDINLGLNYLNEVKPDLYFNGTEVAAVSANPPYSTSQYTFRIPKALIRPGRPNVIALREHAPSPDSTFWQHTKDMGLPGADPKALDDQWKFQAEQTYPALTPDAHKAMPTYPGAQIQYTPGALFNAMIAPLIPYAIKGCIWYQGENNVGQPQQYKGLLTDLITDWRGRWGEGDFPFEIEQLANYYETSQQPEVQRHRRGARGAASGQRGAAEHGPGRGDRHRRSEHPSRKTSARSGRRLALIALNRTYHQPQPDSGPIYAGMKAEGGSITVSFRHADGLTAKGGRLAAVRHRGRRPEVRLGGRQDRGADRGGLQPPGPAPGGGALRLGGQPAGLQLV